ncbi:non-ribosomal peptide synthetase, partial [Alkalimonas amylolytica]
MKTEQLLKRLREHQVRLKLESDKLICELPQQGIPAELRSLLIAHKDELKNFLRSLQQVNSVEIPSRPRQTHWPLSYAQNRLWLAEQMAGQESQYNSYFTFAVSGLLQPAALAQAFDSIVERHESLRTGYALIQGQGQQWIYPVEQVKNQVLLEVLDGQELDDTALTALLRSRIQHRFKLDQDVLLRVVQVQQSANQSLVMLVVHHIASDGWSGAVLAQEFSHFYRQALGQQVMELPELRIQYVDFACWQRSAGGEQQWRPLLPYWQQRLQDLPAVHQLPLDAVRPAEQNFQGSQMLQHLPQPLYQSLQHLAAQQGVTLFMLLHTVLGLLIGRLSAQTDVVIGVPVANRNQPELEPLIGFFVNTLVTRLQWQPDQTFISLLQQNKDALLEDFRHQQMPFDVLVEQLQPERLPGIAPLFQILFIMQNNKTAELNVPAASIRPIVFDGGVTRFDLELYATEQEEGLELCWNYASSLFNNHTIVMLQQSYLQLLQSVLLLPEQQVSLLALVSEEEQQQLLRQSIGPQLPAPVQPVQHMFEAQARLQPTQTALLDDENKYSYQQLEQRANGLAHLLRDEYQCQSGQLVAFCLPRGIGQISTMLAILKAGCCYMPLDPSLPDERLHQIVRQYPELLVLTDQQNAGRFSASASASASALRLLLDIPLAMKEQPPEVSDWRPEFPVYLLHTSGSTGQPKAIQMPHRALVNHLYSLQQDTCVLQGPNRSLHYASVGFDMSFTDIFLTLSGGGQLVLMDGARQYDPAYLAQLVEQHQLSTLNLPYAMLAMLAEHLQQQQQTLPSLQCITVSAEQMKITEALRSWAERQPQLQLLNHYGPSETHVVTSWKLSGPPQQWPVLPPIGLPLANIRCYVLDAQRQLVPAGVVGELYLGGACLSSGYLGQAGLTAERFVQDPFSTEQAAQMYQTGDLVRRRYDGVLEYIGRNDFQIKIRGFRIELGDVEAALRQCGVSECLALALADARGDLQLVAYYRAETERDAFQLQQQLARLLPAYMVPAVLVAVDAFVLNANGKIDRKALPAAKMPERQDAFIEPQSATEQVLARLWQEVLQSGPVSTSDNFFALGGHSLLVMNLVAKAQERQLKLDAAQVFASATLAELARTVEQQTQKFSVIPGPAIPVGTQVLTPDMFPLLTLTEAELANVVASVPGGVTNIQDIYPLTALQQGFLFHHLLDENTADGYLQHPVLKVCGTVQTERLLSLLPSLFQRHDVLRTLILHKGLEQPVQVVCLQHELPVEHCVLQAADSDHAYQQQLIAKAPVRLPLDRAPLVRILVGHLDGEESVYVLVLWHHIISDHVGVEIIGQELLALLEQQPLPPAAQYRDQISWMQFCRQQLDPQQYFRNELEDFSVPALPFDLREVLENSHKPDIEAWSLTMTQSSQIRQLCRNMSVSPAVWFHAIWALVVGQTSDKDDVVFGTVMSGRMHGSAGIDRMAGLMINTLPIRFRLAKQSMQQLLLQAEQQLRQLLPFEQVALTEARACSAVPFNAPLFSALLNYRHTEIVTEKLSAHGLSLILPADQSNYPFALTIDDSGASYPFMLNVQTLGVAAQRVKAIVQFALDTHLNISQQEELRSQEILLLSALPVEERELFDHWNNTATEHPVASLLHEPFEAMARQYPAAIA